MNNYAIDSEGNLIEVMPYNVDILPLNEAIRSMRYYIINKCRSNEQPFMGTDDTEGTKDFDCDDDEPYWSGGF